ncbi:MAG: thymidine phosphorylase [Xanthomonadales bacterium]|nr:thymidine phosphorylase [Xanthomonadales bacterium]
MFSVSDILDRKRRGEALGASDIADFIVGVRNGEVSDAQLGAFTMAVRYQGMNVDEQTAMTLAMRDSGTVLRWKDLDGPVLDKHSTGGVGDWVSLALAPLVAAAGGYVPMISGRGLGHTGGTLDKLESIPGFSIQVDLDALRELVRRNGVAMIGQGPELAPADGRIYAVRDITSTVESIPLIVSSILSKKLAEGLDGLVLDVKTGNGAFMPSLAQSEALARQLCHTASRAGTPCHALITDMNQPLGHSAGNALEVREAVRFLTGEERQPRMREVIVELCADLLVLGRLAASHGAARARLQELLDSGAAAERFGILVAAQGGPSDLVERHDHYLPQAPVVGEVVADRSGWVASVDTRALGMAVLRLGGGRVSVSDTIDPAVGLSRMIGIGDRVAKGEPLCLVHAASEADGEAAAQRVRDAFHWSEQPPPRQDVIYERLA